MNEFAFADVNTHMAKCASHSIEKHQVAGLQIGTVNILCGSGLLFGAARQDQTNALFVHGAHKTAAVKTSFNRVAAAFVGHTQKTHGVHYQF